MRELGTSHINISCYTTFKYLSRSYTVYTVQCIVYSVYTMKYISIHISRQCLLDTYICLPRSITRPDIKVPLIAWPPAT